MLRTTIIGLWACGVTAGALFLAPGNSGKNILVEAQNSNVEIEQIFTKPLIVFVPVVSMSKVTGYLFANISVLADSKLHEEATVPLSMLIQDSYLTYLTGNEEFALPDILKFDDRKLKAGVRKLINQTAGRNLVEAVYISDLNFLTVHEIRGGSAPKTIKLHEQEAPGVKPKY